MIKLIPSLRDHFDNLQDRLQVFHKYSVQLEGWFKGELLFVLDHLLMEGRISTVDREVRVGSKRVDLMLGLADGHHWIELKYWLIGKQKGSDYGAHFYFNDPTSVGIAKDVKSLGKIDAAGRKWLLILLVKNPGVEEWETGVVEHCVKFRHTITSRSDPRDFPASYFLGLLEVRSIRG